MRIAAIVLTVMLLAPALHAGECLSKDKTGLAWVHPFPKALAKAKAETRILMIKPVAFGTTPDGGW